MSKSDITRAYIIEKAAPVFNSKGYQQTSLSDIMEATGLTKGALYGHFSCKNELAIVSFTYQVQNLHRKFRNVMDPEETAYGKLQALLNFYRINWKRICERGGCPILNASTEADDSAEFLREHVQLTLRRWVSNLAGVIRKGQESGEFRRKADPMLYAYTIISMLEGGMMMSRILHTRKLMILALTRIEKVIDEELVC